MKRAKESGASYRKKRKAKEQFIKSNEGSIFKFVSRCAESDSVVDHAESNINSGASLSAAEQDSLNSKDSVDEPPQPNLVQERNVQVQLESESQENATVCSDILHNDVGYWPHKITSEFRNTIVTQGFQRYQHLEGPFSPVLRTLKEKGVESTIFHYLNAKWFYKILKNGDRILRNWLVYSPCHKGLYCFCCKLFSTDPNSVVFVSKPFSNYCDCKV
jgi:hypothetical protein